MSKRAAAGRRVGFFKRLVDVSEVEAEDDRVVERRLEVGEELEDGVYRVERVVERRKRKVSCSCTVDYFGTIYYTSTVLGENGVFGAMGRVQAGGGDMGQGGRGDCCSIEVSCQAILM